MTTETTTAIEPFTLESPVPTFPTSDEAIESLRQNMVGLTAKTPAGYKAVKSARQELRRARTGVEERRVELKAGALEWGRKVDGEAKRLTGLLKEIEVVLDAEIQAADQVKEDARLAKEAEERAKIKAELEAKLAEQDAKFKAEREAEAERVRIERERLQAEAEEMARKFREETERREAEAAAAALKQREESDRLKAERDALEAAQARLQAELEALRPLQTLPLLQPETGTPANGSEENIDDGPWIQAQIDALSSEGKFPAIISGQPYHTKPPTVDNPVGVAVDCDPNVRYCWTTKRHWDEGYGGKSFMTEEDARQAGEEVKRQEGWGDAIHTFQMRKLTPKEIAGHNFSEEQLREELETNGSYLGASEDAFEGPNYEELADIIISWVDDNISAWVPEERFVLEIK